MCDLELFSKIGYPVTNFGFTGLLCSISIVASYIYAYSSDVIKMATTNLKVCSYVV